MRNTLQYPITDAEIISVLNELASELDQKNAEELRCGDIRPLALREAARKIDLLQNNSQ